MEIDTQASDMTFDLAVDTTEARSPSPLAAGIDFSALESEGSSAATALVVAGIVAACFVAVIGLQNARRVFPSA